MVIEHMHSLPEPVLLRIHPDVTRITQFGRSTIYQEIQCGRMRAVKIGRSVRVRREDLDRWLDQYTTAVVTE